VVSPEVVSNKTDYLGLSTSNISNSSANKSFIQILYGMS
jgi:hypothetical protein